MQKIILIIIGVIIIAAGVWYFMSSNTPNTVNQEDAGSTVATVNGEEISRGEFEEFKTQIAAQQGIDFASLDAETRAQFEEQILNELINQTLLQQIVADAEITASSDDVDAQITAIITQVGGEEAFREALADQELSEEEFRTQISGDLAVQAYFEEQLNLSAITATDEEIEETYTQVAAQNEDLPLLEEVRAQVEQSVIQQKQQAALAEFVAELRQEADIEILL